MTEYPLFTTSSIVREGEVWGSIGVFGTPVDTMYALWRDSCIRFRATTSSLLVTNYANGTSLQLFVDGVAHGGLVNTGSSNTIAQITLASDLDGTTEHLYEIILADRVQAAWYCYSVTTDGALGTPPAVRDILATYGDSITQATQGTGGNCSQGYSRKIGELRHLAVWQRGIDSTTTETFSDVDTPTGTQAGQNRTADITGITPEARFGIVIYGSNDRAFGESGSVPSTASSFQAAYTDMLTKLLAGTTSTHFLCSGIIPRAALDTTSYNAAIQAAILAANSTRLTYIDPSLYNINLATDTADQIHPNDAGYAKIASVLNSQIAFIDNPTAPASAPTVALTGIAGGYRVTRGTVAGATAYTLKINGSVITASMGTTYDVTDADLSDVSKIEVFATNSHGDGPSTIKHLGGSASGGAHGIHTGGGL